MVIGPDVGILLLPGRVLYQPAIVPGWMGDGC